MGYELNITPLAHQDLDEILTYISTELLSPGAAADFADQVEACHEHLKAHPFMFAQCNDPGLAFRGYRRALVKNYLIVYKVDEEKRLVHIHRVFHGTRNYVELI